VLPRKSACLAYPVFENFSSQLARVRERSKGKFLGKTGGFQLHPANGRKISRRYSQKLAGLA
jgi:hypothetical protein